jgi:hypothetical protein
MTFDHSKQSISRTKVYRTSSCLDAGLPRFNYDTQGGCVRERYHDANICTKRMVHAMLCFQKIKNYDWNVLLRPAFSFWALGRLLGASVKPEKGANCGFFFFFSFLSFLSFLPFFSASLACKIEGALA